MSANMSKYITDIDVSSNPSEEQKLQMQLFHKIDVPLSQDKSGNAVYLWYTSRKDVKPITRIQFSCNDDMCKGLINEGYSKVDKNLTCGKPVFLWYSRGSTSFDTPIVKLEVSTNPDDEAEKMKFGWEKAGCNLSGDDKNWVYVWVKRAQQTYISDVTATNSYGSDEDLFHDGYIRIDETTNTIPGGKSSTNFLWYRQTTDAKNAVTDLKISTNHQQYQQYQQQEYKPVSVNLNEGTGGRAVYLWYKKENGEPSVESMVLLLNKSGIKTCEKAGIDVIEENINEGNCGDRYLCFLKKQ